METKKNAQKEEAAPELGIWKDLKEMELGI